MPRQVSHAQPVQFSGKLILRIASVDQREGIDSEVTSLSSGPNLKVFIHRVSLISCSPVSMIRAMVVTDIDHTMVEGATVMFFLPKRSSCRTVRCHVLVLPGRYMWS